MLEIRLWIAVFFLLAPAIFASSLGDIELADSLGDIGNMMEDILRNDDAMFALVFVILYILIYNLLKMLFASVPLLGESKPARTIAGAISLLAVIGLFWQGKTIIDNAAGIAGGLGPLTLILAGIILFGGITRKTNLKWGGFIAGALMIGAGIFFESQWLFPVGVFFIILGILKTTANAGNPYTHPNASPGRKRKWAKNALGGLGKIGKDTANAIKDNETLRNMARNIMPRAKRKEEIEADLRHIDNVMMYEMKNLEPMILHGDVKILNDKISRMIQGLKREMNDFELLEKEDEYEEGILEEEEKRTIHDKERLEKDFKDLRDDGIRSQTEWDLEKIEEENLKEMQKMEKDLDKVSHSLHHEKRDLVHLIHKIKNQLHILMKIQKMLGHEPRKRILKEFEKVKDTQAKVHKKEEKVMEETKESEEEMSDLEKEVETSIKEENLEEEDIQKEEQEIEGISRTS